MTRRILLTTVLALSSLTLLGQPARAEDIGAKMEREYGVVDRSTTEGRRLSDRLDRIVRRISGALGYSLKSAKLLGGKTEKNDKVVNAFALGDGRIYVTLGLMRLVDQDSTAEDQVAFVVGHEVTHVVEKHVGEQQRKILNVGIAAILLGLLTKDRTVAQAAEIGASAYVSHYSRVDEYEADKGGLKAMYSAGYEMNAAVTMLKHLQAQGGGGQGKFVNGLFGSHPITENRIARIKQQIADIRAGRVSGAPTEEELKRDEQKARRKKNRK